MRAIAAAKDTVGQEVTPGRWFLYRRRRVLVHPDLLDGKRADWRYANELLKRANADYAEEAPRRSSQAVGLELLEVDEQVSLPSFVRGLRRIAPEAVSLEHVLIADPHRFFGCDPAEPAERPGDIPGTDAKAGAGLTAAVLDTGLWDGWGLSASAGAAEAEVLDADADSCSMRPRATAPS